MKKVKVTEEQIKNAVYQFKILFENIMYLTKEDISTVLILELKMYDPLSITDINKIQKLFDKYNLD